MSQARPMAVVSSHHGHGGAGLGGAAGSGGGLRRTWLCASVGSPPQDAAFADAQLRSMARHWGRNLTRPVPVPVAARW
jgi:hypothetical protein